MKKDVEIQIDEDGTIRTVHQEGIEEFAEALGGEISTSCRASNVEWEDFGNDEKGWTVRSAYDPSLALRGFIGENFIGRIICSRDEKYDIHVFNTREKAIEWELKFFWELLAPRKEQSEQHKSNTD